MDAPELFKGNLELIDRVARMVCARRHLGTDDVEDFVSSARLSLLEDDYAVLRRYQGRASLASFLAVVFDHLLSDQRNDALGRWRASRAAERLGPAGVLLEMLVHRDGKTADEALPLVRQIDATVTRGTLDSMLAQLPNRVPRFRAVAIDELGEIPVASHERSDARVVAQEAHSVAARTSGIIRRTIDTFPLDDRMLIRMHFVSKTSIADISRMLRIPQRPLYRRMESMLARMRRAIEAEGLDSRTILDAIGAASTDLNFGLQQQSEASP